MRRFFRNKWVIFSAVLILVIILIVLTKMAFSPTNSPTKNITYTPTPIPKIADLCAKFPKVQGEITCEDAVKKATTDTKGKITNIAIGQLASNLALARTSNSPKKQMWLIDIDLEKPLATTKGDEIKFLRIGIPIDGTDILYRIPIKP